jgi:hypothetical protein
MIYPMKDILKFSELNSNLQKNYNMQQFESK